MKTIEKKILPEYFAQVLSGNKTFELRKDEDDYQVGDILILKEWDDEFTGREITCEITYVLHNVPQYGLDKDYCIIAFKIKSKFNTAHLEQQLKGDK